jgi:F-type H+-transporting ATPase subunit b
MEFFNPHLYDLSNPELWVAVGLILFIAIVVFSGALKMVGAALDAKAAKIQSELDEAARLRAEAEALLAQICQERAEAEPQAADMLKAAEDEARRMETETKAKLEESLARRQQLAERRIAQAEAQATADVKAAAVELAAKQAETILAARLAAGGADPVLDQAVAQIGDRLN